MRVKPSPLAAIVAIVGYLVVVFSVWVVTGLDYDEIGDTVGNVRSGVTVPIGLGAIFLLVVVTTLGWWRPSLHEPRRVGHAWMWVIPALLLLGAVGNLAGTRWDRIDDLGVYLLWLGTGCALVGFSEELLTRGQLIVAARGTLHEGWVWFASSLTFGLLHAPNALFGQSIAATGQQIGFAFLVGTAYYVTRRISGALVVTMALHALWDFSTFIRAHSVDRLDDAPLPVGALVLWPAILLALIALWRIHRTEGDVVAPGGDQLAALSGS
jgi:membrane protease YdiL (CAAX protease family)